MRRSYSKFNELLNNDWSIYYLNDLIDKAVIQIEAFDKDSRDIELRLKDLF